MNIKVLVDYPPERVFGVLSDFRQFPESLRKNMVSSTKSSTVIKKLNLAVENTVIVPNEHLIVDVFQYGKISVNLARKKSDKTMVELDWVPDKELGFFKRALVNNLIKNYSPIIVEEIKKMRF